jgi:hypothetical protein
VRIGVRCLTIPAIVAVAAAVTLGAGAGSAGAVTGHAGRIAVSVTPTSRVTDGEAVAIHAEAPAGIVIYQISAHLCLPGPNVRTNFDFGFQGQRCSNKALGRGDVEQTVEFADGVKAGSLDSFKVGEGSLLWVDELGYPKTISCGPGHPCDLVVRVQITDNTVFFTTPLCYGPTCPADTSSTPTTTQPGGSSGPGSGPGGSGRGISGGGTSGSGSHASGGSSQSVAKGGRASAGSGANAAAGKGSGDRALGADGSAGTAGLATPVTVVVRSHPVSWLLAAAALGAVGGAGMVLMVGRLRRRPIRRAVARPGEILETA